MKIKYSFVVLLFMLVSYSSHLSAAFDSAGTEYSNQGTDTWIQDRAADGLSMVNAFVCILQNGNGGTRPNATWKGMIDELKCGLKNADEAASGAVSYADATMTSTRAGDSANQEMKAYFASTSGDNYLASISVNSSTASAFDLVMDFRWYRSTGDNIQGTHSNTMNGWSEISVSDNNSDGDLDTVIRHTDYGPAEGGDPEYLFGVAAVTYGPDDKVTKFVSSNNDRQLGFPVIYQGVTDATKYRRKTIKASDSSVLDTSCFDRSKQWANTYGYNLYDNVTGAEKKISGSFGFTYSNGTKRGFMGHWGVHLDGGNSDYPNSSTSVAMVQENTDDNMTLYAAPGRLQKITQDSIVIKDGEKFRIWAGSGEKDIFYKTGCGTSNFTTADDGTCSEFTYPGTYWKVQSGGGNLIGAGDWMYSEMNRADIMLESVPNAILFKRDRVTPSSTSPSLATDLALTCVGWCPKSKPTKTEREQYNFENFCKHPFTSSWNDGQGDPGDDTGCTYTYKNRGDNTNALTMMRGSDPVIMYNNSNAVMTLADATMGRNYHVGGGRYILTSDLDATDGASNCRAREKDDTNGDIWNCSGGVFQWSTGIERWDQYYYAKYDNNSYVTIQNPVVVKYTFASTHDQNNDNFSQAAPFSYVWKKDNVDGSGFRDGSGYTNTDKTAYPAQFNGKEFLLQYEGSNNLQGLPERRTDNDWLRLINPKSGTQVVDADNASQGYVLKAAATGMMLAKHGTPTACDAMTFDFAASAIPSNQDKPVPQFKWASKPEVEKVSVVHGVEQ